MNQRRRDASPGTPDQPTEHQEQVILMTRVSWMLPRNLQGSIWANANGGHRDKRTAARMKGEGIKRGVPDLTIAIPSRGFHGGYIELKRRHGGKESDEQYGMRMRLTKSGYWSVLCYGSDEAWEKLCWYLELNTQTGKPIQ